MSAQYVVSEIVDEDSGFGDAMPYKIPLAVFPTYREAQSYCDKYSNQIVYAEPYSELTFGKLVVDSVVNRPIIPAQQLPKYDDRSHFYD